MWDETALIIFFERENPITIFIFAFNAIIMHLEVNTVKYLMNITLFL